MRKITTYIVALFSVLVIFSSCKKEYETIEELDNKNIAAYKQSSGLTFVDDPSGYSYSITEAGSGDVLKNTDSVYYSYKFKSTTGTVYNETSDLMIPGTLLGYTDQFTVGTSSYVFTPIREVLSKLKRGGKAVLAVPSRMAFGKNGLTTFGIASNEIIIVELGIYSYAKRHEVDAFEIDKFVDDNNLTFTTDPSGVLYRISSAGTGTDAITMRTTFTCNYTGRYLDGTVFDEGTGVSFRLGEVIKGWEVIAGKVTEGGKIRVIIPSHLAYGARPLDFDIEITDVTVD